MRDDIDIIKTKGDIIQFPTDRVNDADNDRSEKRTIKNVNIRKSALEVSKMQVAKKKKLALKRRIAKFIVVATALAIASCAVKDFISVTNEPVPSFTSSEDSFKSGIKETILDNTQVDVSVGEINGLDVVLVNDGIDSNSLDKCQADLAKMGINARIKDINDNDLDGISLFVAFKSYNGDKEMAVANYYGDEHSHASDFLAVAMAASFNDSGDNIESSEIQRGNYKITQDITELGPTNIEQKVNRELAKVTVDIPNGQDIDASKIANGLARYWGYFKRDGSVYDESYLERKDRDMEGNARVVFARKLAYPFKAVNKVNLIDSKINTNNKENGL